MRVTKSSQKSINLISNSIILCVLSFISIFVATSAHAAMGDLVQVYNFASQSVRFNGQLAATDDRVLMSIYDYSRDAEFVEMFEKSTGKHLKEYDYPEFDYGLGNIALTAIGNTFYVSAPINLNGGIQQTIFSMHDGSENLILEYGYPVQRFNCSYFGKQKANANEPLLFAVRAEFNNTLPYPGAVFLEQNQDLTDYYVFNNPVSEPQSRFAHAVDMSQTHVLISDPSREVNLVYLYDINSKQLLHTFTPPAIDYRYVAKYGFGTSLALQNDKVIVGSPASRSYISYGAVFIFDVNTYDLLHTIKLPELYAYGFGYSIVTVGDYFAVCGNDGVSSIFIYDQTGELVHQIHSQNYTEGDFLIEMEFLSDINSDDQYLYIPARQTITNLLTGEKTYPDVVYQYEIPEPASLSTLLAASLLILHRRPPHPLRN